MAGADDEFAEFETDEATFDAMMAAAEPAELVDSPGRVTIMSAADDRFEYASGLPIVAPSTSTGARSSRRSLIASSGVASIETLDGVAS